MNIPSQHLHIYFLYICELKKKASRIKSIKLTLLCKSRVSRFYVRVSSPFPSGCGQLAWVLWPQWSSFNCAMGAPSLLRSLMSSKDLTWSSGHRWMRWRITLYPRVWSGTMCAPSCISLDTLQCNLPRGAIQGISMYTMMRTWWDWSKRSMKSATLSMFPGWPCRDIFCMYVCCGPVRAQFCDRWLAKRIIEHQSLFARGIALSTFFGQLIRFFLGGFANPPAVWLKCGRIDRVWQVQNRFSMRDMCL